MFFILVLAVQASEQLTRNPLYYIFTHFLKVIYIQCLKCGKYGQGKNHNAKIYIPPLASKLPNTLLVYASSFLFLQYTCVCVERWAKMWGSGFLFFISCLKQLSF